MLRLHARFASLAGVALVAALLASEPVSGQSSSALWRFVYPDAQALISIDWARIRQSPAGAMIREKWLNTGALPAIPGMELLNDVDRVLISSPGKNSPDDAAESPILVAIQGHFEAAKVRQVFAHLGAKAQTYNSFQIYRPQGKDAKDTAWVLFDAETILFGDAPAIFAALDRNQFAQPSSQTPPPSGSLTSRAAEMEANYEFWVIMDATEIMSSDQIAALFRGGEWATEAQGFQAGINLRTGLAADITVRFSSDATAKRVTTELTRIMNLAAKDKSTDAPLQDIAKKLKFSLDGSATKISLRLTQQELEKSAQAFAASHKVSPQFAGKAVGEAGTIANSTPAPTSSQVPGKPAVIRIEGLDDGPREIPYPDQQH